MKYILFLFTLFTLKSGTAPTPFREKVLNYTRVREAYAQKSGSIKKTLTEHSISTDSLRIYLRAFKTEKKMEVWARNINDSVFTMVREIPICEISGSVGPKRCSHDLQVPEGFYRISEMNPYSKYYLSLKINYPNASDSIRGVHGRWGNLIYIHGGCESSGCIAITDERIKELYVYCIEAYNSGQKDINITIYPSRLTDSNYSRLTSGNCKNKDKISLWCELKKSYDLFEKKKTPPAVKFLSDGTHEISIAPKTVPQTCSNDASPVSIQQ